MSFVLQGKCFFSSYRLAIIDVYHSAVWKVIRSWMPAEADQFIKFVDTKSITQYIRSDQLSTAMGGTVSEKI